MSHKVQPIASVPSAARLYATAEREDDHTSDDSDADPPRHAPNTSKSIDGHHEQKNQHAHQHSASHDDAPNGASSAPSGDEPSPAQRHAFSLGDITAAARIVHEEDNMAKRPWYIIDPRNSFMSYWDALGALALIFTLIVTPFEVGFIPPAQCFNWLFVINRLVDLIFFADLIIQFFLMYRITKTKGLKEAFDYEYRIDKIAKHYIKSGWFFMDLGSLAPSAFDIYPLTQSVCWLTPSAEQLGTIADSSVSSLSGLRVVRTFRLVKLIRLVRSSRVLKRWETRISWPYSTITLLQLLLVVVGLTHILACLFGLSATLGPVESESKLGTWMATKGFCEYRFSQTAAPCAAADGTFYPCGELEELDSAAADAGVMCPAAVALLNQTAAVPGACVICEGMWMLYLASVYWTLGCILGFAAEPPMGRFAPTFRSLDEATLNVGELLVFILAVCLGAMLWAYVTAIFVDVIANSNPDATNFRNQLDDLNRFCAFNRLPPRSGQALREYHYESWQKQLAESRQRVADQLSPKLQADVAWEVNRKWLEGIPFLRRAEKTMLVRIALSLRPYVYAPRERPPPRRLYVIFKGAATFKGKTLTDGDFWGEQDVLLRSQRVRRPTAFTITYLHVYFIGPDTIEEISKDFPESYRMMRTWVIFQAIKEYLLDYLHEQRAKFHGNLVDRMKRAIEEEEAEETAKKRSPSIVSVAAVAEQAKAAPAQADAVAAPVAASSGEQLLQLFGELKAQQGTLERQLGEMNRKIELLLAGGGSLQ